jgi:DNA-binding MarR family transcriptional regulator
VLSPKQRAAVERCASLYGATLSEVAAAIGMEIREASWVTEGLVRRRVLERTVEGRVVRERDRPRRCNCYRLTEFGWELLTAEVSHAAE